MNYKVSNNKHTTDEDKNNQIHSQINIHNKHLKNITKNEKYKKLNMTEYKRYMNITGKLNNISITERKTEYNYTLVKQHFYKWTLNITQLHFDETSNKHKK